MPSPNEYRQMDLDDAANSLVARRDGKVGTALKVVTVVGGLVIAALLLYSGLTPKRSKLLTDPDKDQFTTTQFPAPSIDTPRPQLDQGAIFIPPAPPPEPPPTPPPTTLTAPPPPISPPVTDNGDEARRLAELERQRLAEEEKQKWARLRAGQLVSDAGGTGGTGGTGLGDGSNATSNNQPVAQEDDPNRRFLANSSKATVEVSKASQNTRIDALVPQGTIIPGVLETAIQSDLPGVIRAVTTEDVWSFDGRRVLIPSGTRLIGEYRSGLSTGQTRVFIVWNRLLRSDGVSVDLGSTGTDALGRAGMAGDVDQHYFERYGAATLLSIVGGGAQLLGVLGQNRNNGNTTTTTYDPRTGLTSTTTQNNNNNDYQTQARQIGAQAISQSITNMANDALKDSLKIPPTIYIDQGSSILVIAKRDLDFSALYPDPVKEAVREIRRERAANRISR